MKNQSYVVEPTPSENRFAFAWEIGNVEGELGRERAPSNHRGEYSKGSSRAKITSDELVPKFQENPSNKGCGNVLVRN
jgi:hypothetical protein